MMHGYETSDSVIVAVKPTNKAEQPAAEQSAKGPTAAEPVEPRAETKGNAGQQSTCRAQNRASVTQALDRIRKVAKERKKERFTTLFHHISVDLLRAAFFELKGDAAPGVDRVTWQDYEADLVRRLEDLHGRVHRGAYRALPSRRVYIPKPDGRQRPLAVAALEDKIVQRAVVTLLNAIYEEDFLGISYGFRPGRGTEPVSRRANSRSKGRPVATACGRSSRRSKRSCGSACTTRFPTREGGCDGFVRGARGNPRSLIATQKASTKLSVSHDFFLTSHFSSSTAPQAFPRPDRGDAHAVERRSRQGWPLLRPPSGLALMRSSTTAHCFDRGSLSSLSLSPQRSTNC